MSAPKRPCSARCLGHLAERAVGTVAWPAAGPRRGDAHAAVTVCADPAHQRAAEAWVYAITGHLGVLLPYPNRPKETHTS